MIFSCSGTLYKLLTSVFKVHSSVSLIATSLLSFSDLARCTEAWLPSPSLWRILYSSNFLTFCETWLSSPTFLVGSYSSWLFSICLNFYYYNFIFNIFSFISWFTENNSFIINFLFFNWFNKDHLFKSYKLWFWLFHDTRLLVNSNAGDTFI